MEGESWRIMRKLKRLAVISIAGLIIWAAAIITPAMVGTVSADGHSTADCDDGSSDSVERNSYFDGRFLSAEDLSSEQVYSVDEDAEYLIAKYRLGCAELSTFASLIAADQETVRRSRQLVSSQFENANQKASQYVNMIATILKTMKETRTSTIQNLKL